MNTRTAFDRVCSVLTDNGFNYGVRYGKTACRATNMKLVDCIFLHLPNANQSVIERLVCGIKGVIKVSRSNYAFGSWEVDVSIER